MLQFFYSGSWKGFVLQDRWQIVGGNLFRRWRIKTQTRFSFSWPSPAAFVVSRSHRETGIWQVDKNVAATPNWNRIRESWYSYRATTTTRCNKTFFSTLETQIFVFLMTQIRLHRLKLTSKRLFCKQKTLFQRCLQHDECETISVSAWITPRRYQARF